MNITLRQLRAFLAVAQHGSFTRAADQLHVTQSAASGLIRELEGEIGARLFDRTTRRVELTEAGREFEAPARRMLVDLDRAVEDVHDLAERKRGRVTIAAPPLLAATMLPGVIAAYRERFPGIEVIARDLRTDEIVAQVRGGEADCGIGTFAPEEEGIERRRLMTDELMLFCPRGDRIAGSREIDWRGLQDRKLVALTRDSGVRALVDRTLEAANIDPAPAFEVTQMTTAIAMVEARLGVAVLPAYAQAFARLYKVATVPIRRPKVTRDIEFISRRARALSPAAEGFLEVLGALAQSQRFGIAP